MIYHHIKFVLLNDLNHESIMKIRLILAESLKTVEQFDIFKQHELVWAKNKWKNK